MVADCVAPRLGADAYVLASILIDQMDRLRGRPVGFYRSQLCKLCGFPESNPRRFRHARESLIKDGWLICQIPANGERDQAIYEMKLKPLADAGQNDSGEAMIQAESNPGQFGPPKQLTPNQNGPGTGLTRAILADDPSHFGKPPGPDWSLTRANLVCDPGHFGTPSNPKILLTPKILNTPSGTLFDKDSGMPSNSEDDDVPWLQEGDPGFESQSQPKNTKRGSGPFVKPDVATVATYCEQNGYDVDAERFVDFYDSKGWFVGKTKMKDWRAAVRNCHHTGWAKKTVAVNRMPTFEEVQRRGWNPTTGLGD